MRINLIYGFGGIRDRLDLIPPPTRTSKIIVNYLRQFGRIRLKIQTNLKDKDGCMTKTYDEEHKVTKSFIP